MSDYVFAQHGNNNVQIGDMTGMPYHVNTALKWALEHNFQSVAAQYCKTLALEVVRLREDNERLCAALQSSKKRAADYEQTGLTPDEIAALRAENERMRAALDAGKRHMHEAHKKIDNATDLLRSSGAPHDALDLIFGAFWDVDKAMREASEAARAVLGKEQDE